MLLRELTWRISRLTSTVIRCKRRDSRQYGDCRYQDLRLAQKSNHLPEGMKPRVESSQVKAKRQRSVRVAIIGEPNAGKSTLINQYLDQDISSVTEVAYTTNRNVIGVTTDGDTQVVIIDAPGMPYYPGLKKERMKSLTDQYIVPLQQALRSVDLLVYVADSTVPLHKNYLNTAFREMITAVDVPKLLVLNKIDSVNTREKVVQLKEQYTKPLIPKDTLVVPIAQRTDISPPFDLRLRFSDGIRWKNIYAVSALHGTNLQHLRQAIHEHAVYREWEYPHDEVCPDSLEDVVCDLYRAMLLKRMGRQAPHLFKHSVIYVREDGDKVVIGHQASTPMKLFKDKEDLLQVQQEMSERLSERFGINAEIRLQSDWAARPERVDKSRADEEDVF